MRRFVAPLRLALPAPALAPCRAGEAGPEVNLLGRRTETLRHGASSVATMTTGVHGRTWSRRLKLASCLPLELDIYDAEGKIARGPRHSAFRKVGEQDFPVTFTIIPADDGRPSTLSSDQPAFAVANPDDASGLRRLPRRR